MERVVSTTDRVSAGRMKGSLVTSDWLLVPLSLILGLLLVLGGILCYYLTGDRYSAKESLVWPGLPLRVLAGKIDGNEADGLVVSRLDASGRGAMLLSGATLDATTFDRLYLQTSGYASGIRLGLVWGDPSRPRGSQVVWLPEPEGGRADLVLSEQPSWRGSIAGLMLLIQGRLTDQLVIHRITLSPSTPGVLQLLRQLGDEWTAFTGWTHRSINFLPAGKRHGLISPVLAGAIWVAASALFYVLARWIWSGAWRLAPLIVMAMSGWVALDARWQWEYLRQLEVTRNQFAGKSGIEKRLAAVEDRPLYQLAEEIKRVMGSGTGRLLLLPPSDEDRYRYLRFRLNYLLLPLNVSTHWSVPPAKGLHTGDHLFVWSNHPSVRWDGGRGQLLWPGQGGWEAERILAHPNGNLYRLR